MKKNHSRYREVDSYILITNFISKMKLTLFVVLLSIIQAFANIGHSQNTRFTLSKENTSIEDVLGILEKNSDFYFLYNGKLVDVNQKVTISVENELLENTLNELFRNRNITYKIFERQVVLSPSNFVASSEQQKRTISGRVTDTSGATLPGVSVVIKGTTNGVITDNEGKFLLTNIPENAILQFSFVGMKGQEVAVGGKSSIIISMEEETVGIEEVVAIGYGTVKKRDLTGSVAAVKSKDMDKMALNDATKALTGKVAGVLVKENSRPGGGSSMLIRGKRSITAGNEPLLVVDGTPVAGGLNEFPVADIKSMEVLKDASATAIYGSRAANGVIIITTNKAKFNQKGKITYSGYYGIQSAAKKQDYMNAAQYMERNRWYNYMVGRYIDPTKPTLDQDKLMKPYSNTAARANLWDPSTRQLIEAAYAAGTYDPSKLGDTNWLDLQTQIGFATEHQLNFSGGNENLSAYISGNYYQNEGIDIYSKYKRFNIRANIDFKVTDWWTIGFISSNSYVDNPSYGNIDMNTIPVAKVYQDDGRLNYSPGNDGLIKDFWNPLADPQGGVSKEDKTYRLFESISNQIKFGQTGLSYKLLLSFDGAFNNNGLFEGQWSSGQQGNITGKGIGANLARYNRSAIQNYLMENTFNYQKVFGNDHSFGALAGWTLQKFNSESLGASGQNNPVDYQLWHNMSGYVENPRNESEKSTSGLQSFLARMNYAYKDRYLLTASFRTDGSSVFSEGNKYDYFPSFAAAWKLNEEPFLKDKKNIDQLKLRFGYGVIGNSAVSPGSTLSTLRQVASNFGLPGSELPNYGFVPNSLGNILRWEKTGQWNLGFDFAFWNERLSGSLDGYKTKTTDLIMPRKLPIAVAGFDETIQNIGKTSNRGVEISLTSINIGNSKFRWITDIIASYNDERIDAIYKEGDDIGNKWFIGQPINVFYDYKFIRLLDSQINPADQELINAKNKSEGSNKYRDGDVLAEDMDEDGKITADKDRCILGKERPDVIASLTNTFTYQDFEFSFMLYANIGQMGAQSWGGGSERDNNPVIDYWTPQNRDAMFPRLGNSMPTETGSIAYFNASFLRLRNVNLTYNLPSELTRRFKLDKLSVYMALQNPNVILTSSKFKGLDPEYNSNIGGISQPMTVMFGLKVGF